MVGKAVDETGSVARLDVQLEQEPVSPVHISVHSNNTLEGVVSPSSFSFVPEDWARSQIVTVTGQSDTEADGDKTFKVTLDYTSEDSNYGKGTRVVEMQNLDKDVLELENEECTVAEHDQTHQCVIGVRFRSWPTSFQSAEIWVNDAQEKGHDVTETTVLINGRGTRSAGGNITLTRENYGKFNERKIVVAGRDDEVQDGASVTQVEVTKLR